MAIDWTKVQSPMQRQQAAFEDYARGGVIIPGLDRCSDVRENARRFYDRVRDERAEGGDQ